MSFVYEFDINNLKEIYEIDKVAKQANGSALLQSGKSVILATVTIDESKMVDEDFLPLTVQYIEKNYAAGKFPGGFIKRESKPGEFETLTSRIVDRSIRPLFPKGYRYNTVVSILVFSADAEADMQVLALNAASAALYNSSVPVKKSVCGVRVSKDSEGNFVANPKMSELENAPLDLYIAGTSDELLMIEMKVNSTIESIDPASIDAEFANSTIPTMHKANEMNEDELVEAIDFASQAIKEATDCYSKAFDTNAKEQLELEYAIENENSDIVALVESEYVEDLRAAILKMAKSERSIELLNVAKKVASSQPAIDNEWQLADIIKVVEKVKKSLVRAMILNEGLRADGRGCKDVRDIDIETNILPSAHASTLFTRGQTQALVVATLGNERDAQMYEVLTDKTPRNETFMVHYNFPPFSVGEAGFLGAPSRRELGHGNLAKRALEPTINKNCPFTVRLVSEILESNGSSSMATVCGGSLSLKAADIEVSDLVAGVAMGLVMEDDKYAILTDIMGLEDHDGDMDFKVAGTKNGITALQMDIKLGGIELSLLKEALYQAKEAREHILSLMNKASDEIVFSESLPSTSIFSIDPSKIGDIIGQAGKNIKEIIEKFGVAIDLNKKDGSVKITADSKTKVKAAQEHIISIAAKAKETLKFDKLYESDSIYKGKVVRICDFGAFIELPKGGEGLLHISKISKKRVNKVEDVLQVDQEVDVKVVSATRDRIELAHSEYEIREK
jgi:polyribonucleotide nucleotidyltransferase